MKPFKFTIFGLLIGAISCSVNNQIENDFLFNEGPVVITGQIKNPTGKTVSLTSLELTGRSNQVAKLDSLGNFTLKFNILSPHDNYLSHNGQTVFIFTHPNDTIRISANGDDFRETITFSGSNAKFNQSINLLSSEFKELLIETDFFKNKGELPEKEFKEFADSFFDEMELKSDSIINVLKPDNQTIAWIKNYLKYRKAEDLIEFGNHHENELSPDYYDFENDFLQTEKYDFQCSQYFEDFIDKYYLGYKLSQAEGFEEVVKAFREQTYEGLETTMDFFNKNITNKTVKNLAITRLCNSNLKSDYQIVDSIFSTYATYVDDITCQNYILRKLDEKRSGIALVHNLNDLKKLDFIGDVFTEISNTCQGKVLYVDVWGTWCGGCIGSFPTMNKLYAELQTKNIEFIYLCINSTKDNWEKTIKQYNIKGKNFWLSKDQSAILLEKFNFFGVPEYFIIDKNGAIYDGNAKDPYSGALKEELLKLSEI